MRKMFLFVIIGFLFVFSFQAQAMSSAVFYQELRIAAYPPSNPSVGDLTAQQDVMGFIKGVIDTEQTMSAMYPAIRSIAYPSNMSLSQLFRIVLNYMDKYPAQWSMGAAAMTYFAIRDSFGYRQ